MINTNQLPKISDFLAPKCNDKNIENVLRLTAQKLGDRDPSAVTKDEPNELSDDDDENTPAWRSEDHTLIRVPITQSKNSSASSLDIEMIKTKEKVKI